MTALPPVVPINWPRAYRIINSKYPPVDLFEDIADPADWELLASAESKTNPRLHENIGNLDRVSVDRRVSGPGASWVMAPFVHASPDRSGRFHHGQSGAYYAGDCFEVALFETIFHFERFLRATNEPATSSSFRELVGAIRAELHDLRSSNFEGCRDPHSYAESRLLAAVLRAEGSNGVVYQSVRYPDGNCVAAFYPDVVQPPAQGRHLSYHFDGERVDYVKDLSGGEVFRVKP